MGLEIAVCVAPRDRERARVATHQTAGYAAVANAMDNGRSRAVGNVKGATVSAHQSTSDTSTDPGCRIVRRARDVRIGIEVELAVVDGEVAGILGHEATCL